ncbi:MAG: DUF3857 and transglutaminase domain-containing protein [Saccharospirillaceae bacterium]|nr:DUF3857 and transglutaminase domain-containing protein [Pseudomonadales bacterium]NRB81200.1 DUF3857 and transglutaminase domain-containing protein [Saccharospirillaceae bacterium]
MFKIKRFNWISLCLLSCLTTQVFATQDVEYLDQPKWVVSHDFSNVDVSRLAADYLLFDKQVKVFDSQQIVYKRVVYRLNKNSAVEQLSDIFLGFDPAYETLQIHQVNVFRDGKTINRLIPGDVKVSEESSDYLMHTGRKQAKLLLRDIRKGDIIDYSYSVIGKNPVFDDKYTDSVSLKWGVPLVNLYYSVMIEKQRELFYKIHDIQGVKVKQYTDEQFRYYTLHLTNLEAVEEQSELPYWFSPYPYIELSEYKDWSEVANWAVQLFDVKLEADPDLQVFIKQLKSMEKEKAMDEAINFVQEEIRYLGLELGENSHRPHHPAQVFNNRYGDCKDKTLLLKILLSEIGIQSQPALVSSYQSQQLFKSLASPSVFDHVILWVDYKQGYWIDATKTHQSKRINTLYQPNYSAALLVNETTTKLVSAKPNNQYKKISVQENIYAGDYSSAVEIELITTYYGGAAERFRYQVEQDSMSQISDDFINYYRRIFPDIRASKQISVSDDINQNIMILHEQYMVPDYWKIKEGESSSGYELYNQMIGEYLVKPNQIKRFQPYAQQHPITVEYQSNLFISEWIDLGWPFEPLIVENEYFKLESVYKNDLRKISLTSLFQTKKDFVKADDIRQYIKDVEQAEENIYVNQSVTNVTTSKDYETVEKLLLHLNNNRVYKD